jgi:hypothetical protein
MGQSVIEINGTKYDATTGQVVVAPATPLTTRMNQGRNIDGIVTGEPKPLSPKPTKPTILVARSKEELSKQRRVQDIHVVHSGRAKKSKTLMRTIVKKPGAVQSLPHQQPSPIAHSVSYTSAATSSSRLNKALSTPTSAQVTHFTSVAARPGAKLQPTVVGNMPVHAPSAAAHAVAQTTSQVSAQTIIPKSSAATKFVDSQLMKAANDEPSTPFKRKPLHKRVSSRIKTNKLKSVSLSTLAVLLIGGFLAYQNLPSITLALANKDAGITAKIPKGVPSNFAISRKMDRSPGQVVMSFDSRVDDRSFTLTQVKADTTVESLKDVIGRVSDNQFQTYEAGGITLFLSGDGRADWMDGGMRYNITGKTGFSPDQLAQIASSL